MSDDSPQKGIEAACLPQISGFNLGEGATGRARDGGDGVEGGRYDNDARGCEKDSWG